MEIVQEQRHECKVCKKRFFSGRSLGGHMRCHMAMNPAPRDEIPIESNIGSEGDGDGGGQTGYGLRENPKKSWRLSGSNQTAPKQEEEEGGGGAGGGQDHVCKVCGKRFNSSRALFGHMRHHSRQQNLCRECGKGFCSSRALSGHMRCHSKRFQAIDASNSKTSYQSQSQDETSCPTRRKRSQRYKTTSYPSSSNFNDSSSLLAPPSEPELEEGALCLMLLSRAVRSWQESNSVSESSDHNSAIAEPEPKPKPKSSHQNTPILKDGDENFVSNGGETSKMLIEKEKRSESSSGPEYGRNVLFEKKTTEIGSCDSGFELEVYADEFLRNDGLKTKKKKKKKKKKNKLDFESHHESCDGEIEKKFQSEIKIKITDSELGNIDVQSIGLQEASSESLNHNSNKRGKCEPYEPVCNKKRRCGARNNKVFQSRRGRGHRMRCLASNIKKCGKSIQTDGKANSKVEYKETPIEIEEEAAGVSLKRSKDYECEVCFKVFASGQALGGHKRAHYAGSFETGDEKEGATLVVQGEHSDVSDIFDLSLKFPHCS